MNFSLLLSLCCPDISYISSGKVVCCLCSKKFVPPRPPVPPGWKKRGFRARHKRDGNTGNMALSLKNPFLCYCQIGNNLVNLVCFEFWLVRLLGNESSWIFVGISWSMFELRNPPNPSQSHYAAKPDMNSTDTPNMTQFRDFPSSSLVHVHRLNNKIVRNGISTFDAPSHQIFVSLQVQSKDDTRRLSSQHIL